jgi:elongation factor Tu
MGAELFYDNLDVVSDKPLKVLARISVLKTEEGGRNGPFTKSYRPNHNFEGPENRSFFIGQIEVPEGEWVQTGETRDLWITFLNVRGLAEKLTVSRKWRIQEGSKLVASAEILGVE